MNILFVAPRMIGDAVVSSGVLSHLVTTHPGAHVTLVAAPTVAPLFDAMPGRQRTIIIERRPFHLHWLALWAATAATRWDMAIDLRGSGLPYALVARQRFMRRPIPGLRLCEQHAALLGIDPAPVPVVWTDEEARAKAAALIPPGAPIIALCPTASWDPKMWPAERFAALFARLAAEALPGARAVVLGGPGAEERRRAAPLLALLPEALDLVGALTLPEAAACLAACTLAVSNDSGLMHLAAAAGAPTLGLRAHAPERAAAFAPTGRAARWISTSGDDMRAISVDEALSACLALLEVAGEPARD